MASRAASPPNLLQPGGGECGDRRADDASERRAPDPAARRDAPAIARTDRSPGAESSSDRTLRVLRMADMPRWHRLSHRGRRPLLQRSPSLRPRRGRCAADREDGRNLPQGRADRRAYAHERQSGPRRFDALALARGDGRYARLLKNLARADLLILDDWGLAPLTPEQARDLLEIIDDRHGRGSTIVTSQLPVDHWHEVIGNPTIADAIVDRLVQRSPAHIERRQH